MATNWPLDVCSAVSVAQTGVTAFKIPAAILSCLRTPSLVLLGTADHPGVVLSEALKASADNRPSGRDSNSVYAPEFITNIATEKGAEKSTL